MKKQNLVTVTTCSIFFVFFFMFQSSLSIISKLNGVPYSTRAQDKKDLEFKTGSNWEWNQFAPRGREISCDRSHRNYDLCSINGPTILEPKTSTFFLVDPPASTPPSFAEKIRPYPRKYDNLIIKSIKELTITAGPLSPKCEVQHNAPAVVFSAAGYTGNFWHEFSDGFIPLFTTVNSIFSDHDFILVISEAREWWISKYADLLETFSKHPIINLDNETAAHCFTSATLGLISHGHMTINPTLTHNSTTLIHFRAFLEKAYGHGQNHPSDNNSSVARPRLVLVSRKGSVGRLIINEDEVKHVAEEIGFEVIVFVPSPTITLNEAYALMNSSHAMVGVHGAALTHLLFLRPGSVLGQVVPIGLEWVSEVCFAISARDMGLEYMEYKINAEESSLVEKYDKNELLIRDPVAFRGKNWSEAIMNIYLKEQDVIFDLVRFREYLKEIYRRAKQFMDKEE